VNETAVGPIYSDTTFFLPPRLSETDCVCTAVRNVRALIFLSWTALL